MTDMHTETTPAPAAAPLHIKRVHTNPGIHPYDEVEWGVRDIVQTNWKSGDVVFEQRGVEFPKTWSENAATIVTTKYFRGAVGTPQRETSLRQIIDRVVGAYTTAAREHGYFTDDESLEIFDHELKWMLLNQVFSFNSPVWFNVGTESPQQVSACQPYHAPVSTPDGEIPIGLLVEQNKIGEKVLNADGSYAQILAVKNNGLKEVLRLTSDTGHTLDVTADHLVWRAHPDRHDGDWVPAGQLNLGDQLTWHRQPAPAHHVDWDQLTASQAEAALAGWLAAGNPAPLDRLETHWLDTAANALGHPDHTAALAAVAADWQLDAHNPNHPARLDTAPTDTVAAYLRSLYQVCSTFTTNTTDYTAGILLAHQSETVARGAQLLLHRLGILAETQPAETGWTVSITDRPDRARFLSQIVLVTRYRQLEAERAARMPKPAGTDIRRLTLTHIERTGAQQVYDIQTDTGEYLSSGGIRVHNCFILSVSDTMESILNWYREEGLIFKGGSGAGLNLSNIRSSKERLSSGGTASGPVSFMRGADASAGTIKSGGATRRAAKMVVLDVDHPDIAAFVATKAREEEKIRALRDAGFDMDLGGTDIISVQYQNANNSVRVNDEFMNAVEADTGFGLRSRSTGEIIETVSAKKLFREMAEAAWGCADPGIQYDGAIQRWHANPAAGRISASNPCFTGDTLVAVADGRNAVRIDELANQGVPVDVYSRSASGQTVIRRMSKIRMTREGAELVRVSLDDGTYVRCTPDHLFMLRDGSYRAASELCPGDSLARFDSEVVRNGGPSGSLRRRVSSARGWKLQYRMIGERAFGDYRDGKGNFHLDHVDGDSLNDRPDNLQVLTADDHTRKTVQENMIGDRNPARRLMSDKWRENISAAVAGSGNPRWIDVEDGTLAEVFSAAVLADPKAGSHKGHVAWNKYVRKSNLVGTVPLANGRGRIRGQEWEEFANSMLELVPAANHKVVSVEADGRGDVFDGEVDETHNFAIFTLGGQDVRMGALSGVFVHNCSEYLSLDNSSCNLASLNLMKFRRSDGTFDAARFADAVELIITAMDVSISFADFPTEAIGHTTRNYRQLGIGYSNLGALLMAAGLGYDSPEGRAFAAAVTSLMSGVAYRRSAEMAAAVGPYSGFAEDAAAHRKVVGMHGAAAADLVSALRGEGTLVGEEVVGEHAPAVGVAELAAVEWADASRLGLSHGFRNAQVSLLAPTGTISFMMDCDTTGVEPDFALKKFKKLVGGGALEFVNSQVPLALAALGYGKPAADRIVEFISENGHVVGAPGLKPEHYAVFDCAVGERAISPSGHILMMAAVQPFLSGAISKTINLPESATVEEIEDVYLRGWKLGLKALAVYRDNCKVGQPLSSSSTKGEASGEAAPASLGERVPLRKRLPKKRAAETVSFTVGGSEGYLTVGKYEDGGVGELFVKMSKQGSTLAGIMDAFSIAVSLGLQYGVPLEAYVAKFTNMRFEPAGMTDDPDVRMAQSLVDYMFRRVALDHMPFEEREAFGIYSTSERAAALSAQPIDVEEPLPAQDEIAPEAVSGSGHELHHVLDAAEAAAGKGAKVEKPMCVTCGTSQFMVRSGSCWACSCGSTTGCS